MKSLYEELLKRGAHPMHEVEGALSKEEFRAISGAPCVIRGMGRRSEWVCMDKWTWGWLKEHFGDRQSHVTEDGEKFEIWTLRRYLEKIESGDPQFRLYMKDATWWHGTEMTEHFETPPCFENWLSSPSLTDQHPRLNSPNYPSWSWLYLGPAGSSSPLHVDIFDSSAWNLVVRGRKLWIFFPKSERVALENDKGDYVDPFKPDLNAWPQFAHAKGAQIAIQEVGDVMFTPAGWYHAVYNLDAGISLTENFVNETNIFHVLSSLQVSQMENSDPDMHVPIARVLTELRDIMARKLNGVGSGLSWGYPKHT